MESQQASISNSDERSAELVEFTRSGHCFTPAADIFENREMVLIALDMPGVGPEQIEIEIDEGILTITGNVAPRTARGRVLLNEYPVGGYYRSFLLADYIDESRVSAKIKDGVLEVLLQKTKKSLAKKIQIDS